MEPIERQATDEHAETDRSGFAADSLTLRPQSMDDATEPKRNFSHGSAAQGPAHLGARALDLRQDG